MLGSKLTNKMNFGERILNTIVQTALYAITPKLDRIADKLRGEVGVAKSHVASARQVMILMLCIHHSCSLGPLRVALPVSCSSMLSVTAL